MLFIKDWDMVAVDQWLKLDDEYAILTTYPSEIKTGLDEYGNPFTESAPIICNTRLLRTKCNVCCSKGAMKCVQFLLKSCVALTAVLCIILICHLTVLCVI